MIKRFVTPTVAWYLAKRILGPFLLALTAFTLIQLLGEASDRFSTWLRGGVVLLGVKYLALRVPFMVSQLLPVSLLAGVIFGFSMLNRAEEVVALQALGISRARLTIPVLMLAMMVTLFDFGLAEGIVPAANRRAYSLLMTELKRRPPSPQDNGETWVRTQEGFLVAEHFNRVRRELYDVTVFKLGRYPSLRAIMHVQHAVWERAGWRLTGIRSLSVEPGDRVASATGGEVVLDASPADFGSVFSSNPDEFSLAELNGFIRDLRRRGLDPSGYMVMRALKFALPFSCLVMAALGLALSLESSPRRSGFGPKIGLAVAAGVGYWIVLGIMVSFGKSGLAPPWAAVWIPNFLFGGLAFSIFLYGEET
jgi:lipopolysaccharide export system permease protein